jgi:hypothetical protein
MSTTEYSGKRALIIALCLGLLVMALGVISAAAAPAPVDISGTINVPGNPYGALRHTGNPAPPGYSSAYVKGVPEIICMPDVTPTTFTGTLDVSSMPNGSTAFVGLLNKGLMGMNNKGYMSGAYLYVHRLNSTTVTVGPTDGNFGGEIVQNAVNVAIPGDNILDVSITIDGQANANTCASGPVGNGVGCIFTTVEGQNVNDSYGNVKALGSTTAYPHTEFAQGAYPGWDDTDSSKVVYDLEVDGCEATPAEVKITVPDNDTLVCGADGADLNIDFSNVAGLYGYEFKVNYTAANATATGSFVNTWFNTNPPNGVVPPGWGAACNNGACQFAASLQQLPAGISGGGTVGKIHFAPEDAGTFDVTITDVVLSDIDGFPIPVEVDDTPITFTVCGTASVSGKVNLQGRLTPMNGGWITLVDSGGVFPPINETFDANGDYSVPNIPVMPGGSTYEIQATHYLYLGNEKAQLLTPDQNLTLPTTRLLGGDANNSGLIAPFDEGVDISDIGCIGTHFGTAGPGACESNPENATDINNDNKTNIQDLTIAAGNYGKNPFQPW